MTIEAVKKADNSLACVPAFGSMAKTINLQCSYTNPASGTFPVRVAGAALNSADNQNAACDGSGGAVSLAFDANGQVATPTLYYADVGKMTVSASYTGTAGSLDDKLSMTGAGSFVTKPNHFALTIPGNPGATDYSAPVFTKAGESFNIEVAAINASGQVTPNYGRETAPETVKLTNSLVAPVGGDNPTLQGSFGNFGTDCDGNPAGGAACGSFSWGEVGIINLTPSVGDGDYLGDGGCRGGGFREYRSLHSGPLRRGR